jgi:gliding motility-associated-like protein
VNSIPNLVVNATPSEICNGGSSILSVSGASAYNWSTGATGSSITVTPAVTTTYTVTGSNGNCSSSITVVVNVNSPANATINPVNNLCENQSTIVLTAATFGGIWLGPGIIDPYLGLFSPNTAGAGEHTITYMISGLCGDTATIDIVVYPSPNANVYSTDETCFNGNDGKAWVEVSGGSPPYTYLWNTYHTSNIINDLAPGVYYVTVTDIHNCRDKDSVIIGSGIEECLDYHVYIPNVFAPDNMGNSENEMIKVYGKGIVSIDFSIFDRWGNLVFHTTDLKQGWDGTYKGEPALAGDYTYMLRVNYYNGQQETISGHILLIR